MEMKSNHKNFVHLVVLYTYSHLTLSKEYWLKDFEFRVLGNIEAYLVVVI